MPHDLSTTGQTDTTHTYSAGLGFTAYELDFFGRCAASTSRHWKPTSPRSSRYREGVDTFLNTLDAQRNLFSVEQDLVTVKLARINNLISLYKALGGGEAEAPLNL